mgnify:CR=1 FL=1
MLTQQMEKDIEECDRLSEKEQDFVFSFTRCMRRKGYYDHQVWEAIRYVMGLDI